MIFLALRGEKAVVYQGTSDWACLHLFTGNFIVIIVDSDVAVRNNTGRCSLAQCSPLGTFYETNSISCPGHWRGYSPQIVFPLLFLYPCTCVCVCLVLYSFITCMGLCIQRHRVIFIVRTPPGAPSSHIPPPTHDNLLQSYIAIGIQTFVQSTSWRSFRACSSAVSIL